MNKIGRRQRYCPWDRKLLRRQSKKFNGWEGLLVKEKLKILEKEGSLRLFGTEESNDENCIRGRFVFLMKQVAHSSWSVCYHLMGAR